MTDNLKPIPNVTDDEYDGRDFVGEDNRENVEHYVGVDPIYQTYANDTEKPYPFSKEELDDAALRGGLDLDEEGDGEDVEVEDEKKPAKKTAAPPAPKVPEPRPAEK
ncbi:hypothetical protein AB0F25_30495 [Streptomyces wedmorensis]|uniref:hypothetical protein n=1 Tax=Streptomyces wedmorensis TaxID=43759 RepID=UPI003423AC96